MKRLTSILLLFLLTINIVGFVFVFEIQRYTIKKEVAKTLSNFIPANNVTVITVSSLNKKNIIWKEKNEFKYNGLMYDVINKEILSNGTVKYFCLLDKKENNLNKKLNNIINNNLDSQSKTSDISKILVKLFAVNYIPTKKIEFVFCNNVQNIKCFTTEFYTSIKLDLQSPPPKFI
ncbi:MAG: hypothetical protein A2X08_16605 [Bacteroidetes bacterium GWA2_32_17]|nr:MAG: hypothetical protein A2X08_16605 [Bacteroidetes bacterium GWA2_32_17]